MSEGYSDIVNHARYRWLIGYEPSVTYYTNEVYVRLRIWYQTVDGWKISDDNNTITVSGSWTYSARTPLNLKGNESVKEVLLYDGWITVYPQFEHGVQVSFNAVHKDAWGGMNPSVYGSEFIPAKPYGSPITPEWRSISRNSQDKIQLTFRAPSYAGNPVSKVVIERATDGGSWRYLTELNSSGELSYMDSSTSAGHYYQYRIFAQGAGGSSPYATSQSVTYTTPNPPTFVKAKKQGTDIEVSWENQAIGNYTTEIYEGDDYLGEVKAGVTTFLVGSPDSLVTHTYQVRHKVSTLTSEFISSNEVKLSSAPFAPTNLSPNNTGELTEAKVVLSWQYNSSDTSAQSKAEIQVKIKDDWETIRTITSSNSSAEYTLPDTPGQVLWRVRTWGSDQSKPSEYSTASVIIVESPISFSCDVPELVEASSCTVTIQAEKSGVFGKVIVKKETQIVYSATLSLDSEGEGSAVVSPLENNTTYQFEISVGNYAWSLPQVFQVQVRYKGVPPAVISGEFSQETGKTEISVQNTPSDIPGTTLDYNQLEVLSGNTWVPVLTFPQATQKTIVIDSCPDIGTKLYYRVASVSNLGSITYSNVIPVDATSHDVFLNWGVSNSSMIKLSWDLSLETTLAKEYSTRIVFAGHTTPSFIRGDVTVLETHVSATLGKDPYNQASSTMTALHMMFTTAQKVTLRRPDYSRIVGYITDFKTTRDISGKYVVSFTHVQSL